MHSKIHCLTLDLPSTAVLGTIFFFLSGFFFDEHSRITGLQGKGEGISLTPHYHFHSLHRHLDINQGITTQSSPLHIASNRTGTGNFCFPSASREPLSYAPIKNKKLRKCLSSSSFLHYFSGIRGNLEQKNILPSNSKYSSVISCYKRAFFCSILFQNKSPRKRIPQRLT